VPVERDLWGSGCGHRLIHFFAGAKGRKLVIGSRKFQVSKGRQGTSMNVRDLSAQTLSPRLKKMKMLKRLLGFSWWRRREERQPSGMLQPLVDPEEFARLIGSGRVEDLRILARKLSTQPKAHA
jgi:hypothetical protein